MRICIGNIWNDRPALSCEPVMELSEKWAGRSRADKIREIRSKLKEKGADLFILTSLDDIAWLLNIRGNDIHCCPVVLSYLVLDDSELRLLSMKKPFRILLRKHFPKTVLPFIHMMIFTPMCRRFPEEKRYFFPEANVNSRLVNKYSKAGNDPGR